jgi:hypothetical protein
MGLVVVWWLASVWFLGVVRGGCHFFNWGQGGRRFHEEALATAAMRQWVEVWGLHLVVLEKLLEIFLPLKLWLLQNLHLNDPGYLTISAWFKNFKRLNFNKIKVFFGGKITAETLSPARPLGPFSNFHEFIDPFFLSVIFDREIPQLLNNLTLIHVGDWDGTIFRGGDQMASTIWRDGLGHANAAWPFNIFILFLPCARICDI